MGLNKIEICRHLSEIAKELGDLRLENGSGGEYDVRTEIDYNIGDHSGTAWVEVTVDLDEVDQYTELRDEAQELVETANTYGAELETVLESLYELFETPELLQPDKWRLADVDVCHDYALLLQENHSMGRRLDAVIKALEGWQ